MIQIRAYLRGDDPVGDLNKVALSRISLGEVKDYFDNKNKVLDNKSIYDAKKKGMDYKDEIQQLKNKKHLMRLQEDTDESKIIELLKDLEKAKEKDLRAELDKEEIKQAIKDMDHTALTHADRLKRRELEKLSKERENLRVREQEMIDDIKKMEKEMVEREKRFRKEADEARKVNNDDIFAVNEVK